MILKQCRFSFVSFFLVNSRNPILGTQRYRHLVFFLGSSNTKPINFSSLQCKALATFQVSNAKTQQLFRSPMQSPSNFSVPNDTCAWTPNKESICMYMYASICLHVYVCMYTYKYVPTLDRLGQCHNIMLLRLWPWSYNPV